MRLNEVLALYDVYDQKNELRHYGVKGMKWGVRRTPAQLGHDIRRNIKERRDLKNQQRDRYRRERASRAVAKAGSKEKAIKKIDTAEKIKSTLKRGAAFVAASGISMASMSEAMSMATPILTNSGYVMSFAAGTTPIGPLIGAAGALGLAAYAGRSPKSRSRGAQTRVDYIERS